MIIGSKYGAMCIWTKIFDWLTFKGEEKKMSGDKTVVKVSGEGVPASMASGDILLGYGLHEVKVVIDGKPCTVFLSIEDPTDGVAVCHGDVNKIGVRILDDGFIIYADIKTNTASIQWTCEF